MTKTFYNFVLSSSLLLVFLPACAKDSMGTQAGPASSDAGPRTVSDSGTTTEPNMLRDAAVSSSDAAVSGSDAGSGSVGQGTAGRPSEPNEPKAGRAGDTSRGGSGGRSEPTTTADAGNAPDNDSGPVAPDDMCTTCGSCEQTIRVVSTMHTNENVTYADPPPTSGPHNPCWGTWGIHDEPLRAERWVHNLEHGGIVFLYNCPAGCDAEIAQLKDIAGNQERTILTAYADLPTRFGVVSWGHRLLSDCLDEQAFIAFYKRNFDNAPESLATPPNPNCPP